MLEAITLLFVGSVATYLIQKMDRFESKLDALENRVIQLDSRLPRRKEDLTD